MPVAIVNIDCDAAVIVQGDEPLTLDVFIKLGGTKLMNKMRGKPGMWSLH